MSRTAAGPGGTDGRSGRVPETPPPTVPSRTADPSAQRSGSPSECANGAEIIEAYSAIEPDEAFADALEEVHRRMNRPVVIEDPWSEG